MADPTIARGLTSRVSRLTGKTRSIAHTHPTVGYTYNWPLPSDAVEIIRGSYNHGLYDLRQALQDTKKVPVPKNSWVDGKESRSGVMTIFTGSVAWHTSWLGFDRIMKDIDKAAARRGRNVLIMRDKLGTPLDDYFENRSLYDFKGYYDWGVTYVPKDSKLTSLGLIADAACFWNSDHSVGTLLLPGTTTLGGLLRAKTVMRKADIMISTHPPYEYLQSLNSPHASSSNLKYTYSEEDVSNSKLVSEARKIWDPDTHFFSGTRENYGKLLGLGDKRMLTLSGRSSYPVVRWSRGDLEKGPINKPTGYPINPLYYTKI